MDGNVKKRIVGKKIEISEKEKEEGMDTIKVSMQLMLRNQLFKIIIKTN